MKLSWFFEKINKKRTQIDKIINERGNLKLIPQEKKKRIMRPYQQLHADKLDNLEEMDKFLET